MPRPCLRSTLTPESVQLNLHAYPVNAFVSYFTVTHPLTERVLVDSGQRLSRRIIEQLIDANTETIILADAQGCRVRVNIES